MKRTGRCECAHARGRRGCAHRQLRQRRRDILKRTLALGIALALLVATSKHVSLADEPAPRDSFADALGAALASSALLQSERAHVQETAKEQLSVARSHWLPSVSFSGDRSLHHQSEVLAGLPFAVSASGEFRPTDATVSLDQPIYRGGRTLAETDEARAAVSAEQARAAGVEQSVLEQAAEAYIDVAADQELVRLRGEDADDLRRTLAQVRLQHEAGQVTQTDILQAQARVYSSIVELRTAREKLDAGGAEFERAIGYPPSSLRSPGHFIDLPRSLQSALVMAASFNPDSKTAEYDRIQAAAKIRDIDRELLPTLDLEVAYQHQVNPSLVSPLIVTPNKLNDVYVRLSVSLSLFQADVYAQAAGARYGFRSATRKEEDIALTVRAKVEAAWASLTSARDRTLELAAVVKAYQGALDGVRAEQLAGTRTVLDILNAERDLRDAKISQVDAAHDEALAEVSLAVAIGIFGSRELALEPIR